MKRFAIFAAVLLSGCAHIDTGQVDYRIADEPGPLTQRDMTPPKKDDCTSSMKDPCDPLLPSRVIRRYMPDPAKGWDGFKTNDVFSIEIEQGMIGSNTLEGNILGHQFGKKAEIAILANVFEFASQASDGDKKRFLEAGEINGKSDDPSDVELKLIYFSDDVLRRQALNFSNIPLLPRSVYNGGSVGVQLVVMEVDAQAAPVASLLKTLAKFGQQALPIPGEAKDMLFDLGESLLTGSQDDKLLEYRFVLSAPTENDHAFQATFAPGRYVIRRMQDRVSDMGWNNIRLDHNTGRLFSTADGLKFSEIRNDLYMVVNVRKYADGTHPEYYLQKDWSNFRAAFQAAADARAAPLDKVTGDLTAMLAETRSDNLSDGLKLKWAAASSRLSVYASRYAGNLDTVEVGECHVPTLELHRRLDIAERETTDAIRTFRAAYQVALSLKSKDKDGKLIGELTAKDREKIASTVAAYFMPWSSSGAAQETFSTAEKFEANYVAADATKDLAEVALAAAKANAAKSPTCETLIAR